MYFTEKKQKNFSLILNEKELKDLDLYEKIKEDKFIKLLKNSLIRKYYIANNSYGEFLFIYFTYKEEDYFAYGLGKHIYKGIVYKNTWIINTANSFKYFGTDKFNLPLKEALCAIVSRKRKIKKLESTYNEDTEKFNFIADLSDDDFAISNL